MKLATLALASAFALSTIALANAAPKPEVKTHHRTAGMVQLHPNYGNPNGDPDGPTTLSGTGSSQFGGSSPGTDPDGPTTLSGTGSSQFGGSSPGTSGRN